MRNKFPGKCYRCGEWCDAGAGHFERITGMWRVQHADCAIQFRGVPDPTREAVNLERQQRNAKGTGKRAQNARRALRDRAALSQEAPHDR